MAKPKAHTTKLAPKAHKSHRQTDGELRRQADELRNQLKRHNRKYHIQDAPEITDPEYDRLFQKLLHLEEKHHFLRQEDSPTQTIGGAPLESFQKRPHRTPMLSLQNAFNVEDIIQFMKRTQKHLNSKNPIEVLCEPKLDGLALELVYENGYLSHALTRGDGHIGEDVTHNVKTIPSIPQHLPLSHPPKLLEIRGEGLMYKEDFLRCNEQRTTLGDTPFANPRNAAAGTLRQLDPKIASQRPLYFLAYAPGKTSLDFKNQLDFLKYLKSINVPTLIDDALIQKYGNLTQLHTTTNQIIQHYKQLDAIRKKLPFDLDGLVIKVNSYTKQRQLGYIARSPRWAIAAKYKPEQAQTLLKDIKVQVGRTGALTPVAILDPVTLGGVVVSQATLHNQAEMHRKDIRISDTVIVQRAGDVIPQIISPVLSKRSPKTKKFHMPSTCPRCKTPVKPSEEDTILRCPNTLCPAQRLKAMCHFISRKAMNIDTLGSETMANLMEHKLVQEYADLYALTPDELLTLPRQGQKSTTAILKSIDSSRNPTLSKFLYALGLRHIGERTAQILAQHFKTLDHLLQSTPEELSLLKTVKNIGPKVEESLTNLLAPESLNKIQKLRDNGLIVQGHPLLTPEKASVFAEKTFVITGNLPISRDEASLIIESHGGRVSSSVSKKTHYLVWGENAGSKLEKAKRLNVTLLTWANIQKQIANS